jgi:putative PIN family toxin of toxin-antitoxin system
VLRVVLDANVYASALVKPGGPPGRLLHLLLADRAFEVVLSGAILVELHRCLDYPKLRKFIPLTDDEIDRWILALELIADMVTPSREVRAIPEDPDDDHLLAAALEGRAAFLVTGDRHVLALGEYEGVRMVTPAEFLSILGEP